MSKEQVFICSRGAIKSTDIKVQLELRKETIDGFKEKSKGTGYTAKQIMENILNNYIEGVCAT
jgi:hypothetical protein